jgi:hypothetical protein
MELVYICTEDQNMKYFNTIYGLSRCCSPVALSK